MKTVFFHLATTSLDPNSAEILQIGAKCNRDSEPLNIYMMPIDVIKPGAIRKHGLTKSRLRSLNAMESTQGFVEFFNYLEYQHDDPNEEMILVST